MQGIPGAIIFFLCVKEQVVGEKVRGVGKLAMESMCVRCAQVTGRAEGESKAGPPQCLTGRDGQFEGAGSGLQLVFEAPIGCFLEPADPCRAHMDPCLPCPVG